MTCRRIVRTASAVRLCLASGTLFLGAVCSLAPAHADEQAEQRLTLTLLTLDMAQAACGFRMSEPRVSSLLGSANVTRKQLYSRQITPALQASIDGLRNGFVGNAGAACADVWRRFGPDSEAALLTR